MEGWFWRFTDTTNGGVVVALCGVNRHPNGSWATVAVAAHPGALVRSAAVEPAWASSEAFAVGAHDVLTADADSLRVRLDDVQLSVEIHDPFGWPLRLGGGGLFSAIPFLGQYWHPHVLGGRASGELVVGDETTSLDGAHVYAEKNWGAGFPERWWWGQAQGFADPALCVAFGGGRLVAGPIGIDVTGCVIRIGRRVVRFTPPFASVHSRIGGGSWRIDARRRSWRVCIEAQGRGEPPTVLPVPVPEERRNVDRDLEHLAGRIRVRTWRHGRLVIDDESHLAGLEVGSTDAQIWARLAHEHGVTASADPGAA